MMTHLSELVWIFNIFNIIVFMVVLHVSSFHAIMIVCYLIIRLHALYNCMLCLLVNVCILSLCFFMDNNILLVFIFYLSFPFDSKLYKF